MNIEINVKNKFEEIKHKSEQKIYDFKKWCENHQAYVLLFGPVIIGTTGRIIESMVKNNSNKQIKNLINKSIYDARRGHYYKLKRTPKIKEWRIIDERQSRGEPLVDILYDMDFI